MTKSLYKELEDALKLGAFGSYANAQEISEQRFRFSQALTRLRDAKPDTKELGEALEYYQCKIKGKNRFARTMFKTTQSQLEFWGTDDDM